MEASVSAPAAPPRPGSFPRASLAAQAAPYATVFLSSACIMVIELVAGRVVSRYLGQSLYTWTSIIGVVLAGIAVGNYAGGKLADRTWGRATLGAQFLAAALGCLTVLVANRWAGAMPWLVQLPWPARILAHTTAVFLLPAALLGTISPVIAKRALALQQATGRTMGAVYAWSIAGSIVGTILTGFYLPVVLGARATLASASAVLAAVGVVYLAGAAFGRGSTAVAAPAAAAPAPEARPSRGMSALAATVFVASACVMMVEIVAGRLVAREFGQSLFSWTNVIGVVLVGMTLGSYIGGRLADRVRGPQLTAFLFLLSSASCVLILPLHAALSRTTLFEGFSWPMQIFFHVVGAFLLPSVLLGAIPPVIARTALARDPNAGRAVGAIYAWGSAGSIAGTFLAGYYLIAAIGSLNVLLAVAAVLAALSVVYGRRLPLCYAWGGACVVAVLLAAIPVSGARLAAQLLGLRDWPSPYVVYARESRYSYIHITAEPSKPNVRVFNLDQLVHSQIDLDNPLELRYEYEWVYDAVIEQEFGSGTPVNAMVIGGGGYCYPRYLELSRPGSYVEVAEIDPEVTEAAHAAFGLPRDTGIHIFDVDARNRVNDLVRAKRSGETVPEFDCIFGDSINDYTVPYHLTTLEFTRDVHDLLGSRGLYLLNMIDLFDSGRFLAAVVSTCRQVFPHVYVFNTGRPNDVRDTFIVVSADRALNLGAVPERIRVRHDYAGGLVKTATLDELIARTGRKVLTDDYAPVENYLAAVVRTRRKDPGWLAYERARRYAAAGRDGAAIEELYAALDIYPGWFAVSEMLAGLLLERNDGDGAVAVWRGVTEVDPEAREGWYQLGRVLAKLGRNAEAIDAYRSAVAIDPRYAEAQERLGALSLVQGDSTGAVAALEQAVEANPQAVAAHYNLGLAYAAAGDLGRAIQAWRDTVALQPNHDDARYNLVAALHAQGAYREAWSEVKAWREAGGNVDAALVQTLERDSGFRE